MQFLGIVISKADAQTHVCKLINVSPPSILLLSIQVLEPVEIDVAALRHTLSASKGCALTPQQQADRAETARRLLLSTNWMVEAGQKHGRAVIDRYHPLTLLINAVFIAVCCAAGASSSSVRVSDGHSQSLLITAV
jgi:hypothetical protein